MAEATLPSSFNTVTLVLIFSGMGLLILSIVIAFAAVLACRRSGSERQGAPSATDLCLYRCYTCCCNCLCCRLGSRMDSLPAAAPAGGGGTGRVATEAGEGVSTTAGFRLRPTATNERGSTVECQDRDRRILNSGPESEPIVDHDHWDRRREGRSPTKFHGDHVRWIRRDGTRKDAVLSGVGRASVRSEWMSEEMSLCESAVTGITSSRYRRVPFLSRTHSGDQRARVSGSPDKERDGGGIHGKNRMNNRSSLARGPETDYAERGIPLRRMQTAPLPRGVITVVVERESEGHENGDAEEDSCWAKTSDVSQQGVERNENVCAGGDDDKVRDKEAKTEKHTEAAAKEEAQGKKKQGAVEKGAAEEGAAEKEEGREKKEEGEGEGAEGKARKWDRKAEGAEGHGTRKEEEWENEEAEEEAEEGKKEGKDGNEVEDHEEGKEGT